MADDDTEEEEPAVELGEAPTVEGAPLARVASRLTWPAPKSDVLDQEGDTTIRTPDGPRTVQSILGDLDEPYFDTRQAFTQTVRDAIGRGPVSTE